MGHLPIDNLADVSNNRAAMLGRATPSGIPPRTVDSYLSFLKDLSISLGEESPQIKDLTEKLAKSVASDGLSAAELGSPIVRRYMFVFVYSCVFTNFVCSLRVVH